MDPLGSIDARFWRMTRIPYQRDPLSGEGARLYGGRWNARGQAALYLGRGHEPAIAEYHRGLPKPGTLVAYDVRSNAIADLTDGAGGPRDPAVAAAVDCAWTEQMRAGAVPTSWDLIAPLIAIGAHGALVPSVQHRGGTNLVLWRWHAFGDDGDGAAVAVIDPQGDLRPRR